MCRFISFRKSVFFMTLVSVLILVVVSFKIPVYGYSASTRALLLGNCSVVNCVNTESSIQQTAVSRIVMYRLYNKYTGEHFYTSNLEEKTTLVSGGWTDEGTGWIAPSSSNTKVYRLYNPYVPGGDHHYTTDEGEYNKLSTAGWSKEGVGWYSVDEGDSDRIPLYRQYNPYATTGTHNYTKDKTENDKLVSIGWKAEGIGWYGYSKATSSNSSQSLDFSKISVSISNKTYNGKAQTQTVTSSKYRIGIDFTVTYSNNINAGTATMTITGGGSYLGNKKYNFTIKKKQVAVTEGVAVREKTYDGSTKATLDVRNAKVTGSVTDELLIVRSAEGYFSDKNVGESKTIYMKNVVLEAGPDTNIDNYEVVSGGQQVLQGDIERKPLSIKGLVVKNKVYDGNTEAKLSSEGTLDGVVKNDDVKIEKMTASYGDINIGESKEVDIIPELSGNDSSNYSLSSISSKADITPYILTIEGTTVADRTYDGGTDAVITTKGHLVTQALNGEDVSLGNLSAEFADKDAGVNKKVNVTATLNGADSRNYRAEGVTTATISRRSVGITGASAKDKEYDGNEDAIIKDFGIINGVCTGDSISILSVTGEFSDKQVGKGKTVTFKFELTGRDKDNYDVSINSNTANIDPKAITVTGTKVEEREYNGTKNATLVDSGTLDTVCQGDDVSISSLDVEFADKTADDAQTVNVSNIKLTGKDVGNYTISDCTSTGKIKKKTLTITGTTVKNKVYDSKTSAEITAEGTLLGVIAPDAVSIKYQEATFSDKNVGISKTVDIKKVALEGSDSGNYHVADYKVNANIEAKPVTLSGLKVAEKIYDTTTEAQIDATSAIVNEVCSGDTVSIEGITGNFDTKYAGVNKTVTVNALTLAGKDKGNYVLSSTSSTSTGTILPKPVTVSGLTVNEKIYNGTNEAKINIKGAIVDKFFEKDNVNLSSAEGCFDNKHAGDNKAVTLTKLTFSGTDGGNYTLSSSQLPLTGKISAMPVTVSGFTTIEKIYDSTDEANFNIRGATVNQFLSGDNVFLTGITGKFDNKNVGDNKTVTLSGLILMGADADDYTLSKLQETTTGKIVKKTLTISGTSVNDKTYNCDTDATLKTKGDLITPCNNDDVSISSLKVAFLNKSVSSAQTVNVTDVVLGGVDSGNYQVEDYTITGVINKKPTTISGTTVSDKVYNGDQNTTLVSNGNLQDVYASDNVSIKSLNALFNDKNVSNSKIVNVTDVVLEGNEANNYVVYDYKINGKITPKPITVSGTTAKDRNYKAGNTSATLVTTKSVINDGQIIGDDEVSINTIKGSFANANAGNNKSITVKVTLKGSEAYNYTASITESLTASVLANINLVTNNRKVNSTVVVNVKVGATITTKCKNVVGERTGLSVEGFYTDSKCTNDDTHKLTTVKANEITLYTNWIPNGDKDAYWISPSYKITTDNTTEKANQNNDNYVKEAWNVKKSSAEIKEDVAVLKEGSTNDNYSSIKSEYESFMNNDNYHLYTKWNGDTKDASGSEQDLNSYVEFRILEVGTHAENLKCTSAYASDEERAGYTNNDVLTFQATHTLPKASEMFGYDAAKNKKGSLSCTGYHYYSYKNSQIHQLLNSKYYKSQSFFYYFSDNFVKDITKIYKQTEYAPQWYSSIDKYTVWLADKNEIFGLNTKWTTQYAYYKKMTLNTTYEVGGKNNYNPALCKYTRAGNSELYSGKVSPNYKSTGYYYSGWWLRDGNNYHDQTWDIEYKYYMILSNGCTQPYEASVVAAFGLVPCFCF